MIANYPMLAVAVALLWLPRTWMRRGATLWHSRRRRGTANASLDTGSLSFRREFLKARNYFDLLRAAGGALALVGGYGVDGALRAGWEAPNGIALRVLAIKAAIVVVGVLIQTVRFERKVSLSAPVFYLAGLSIAVCSPFVAICAFALAWLFTNVNPRAAGFLVVETVVLAGLGIGLNGLNPLALVGAAMFMVPVLLSLLTRQPLIVFSARSAASSRSSAS